MNVFVAGDDDRARFNAWVAASPLADVLQSYEWGEVKAGTGWRALRLIVEGDDGEIRGTCSVLVTTPLRGVPPIAYAPRGPVVDFRDAATLRALLLEIRRRARGAFLFKCDPPVVAGSDAPKALQRAGLQPVRTGSFGGVQPTAVMVLDLDSDPDTVFGRFKQKWRYNVRLAERKGVTVREGSREDIPAFHTLYLETARRDGFTGRGRRYFERLWDLLEPAGMIRMWVAEYEGAPVSAIVCTMMGRRVIYNYGASSSEHRNVMPNHLVQWTAIRWAAEKGYRLYDFRGVSPVRDGKPVEEHLAGLNRFKEGFGARYVEYAGEFDLPLRPGWYALWKHGAPTAIRVRRALRRGGETAD